MTEYADRNPIALEPYFSRHMSAMTAEKLHSKAAIAEELAYRDQLVDSLRADLSHKTWLMQHAATCLADGASPEVVAKMLRQTSD